MDLTKSQSSALQAKSPVLDTKVQVNELIRALQPIEKITGHMVPRILIPGSIVGIEISAEHLIAVSLYLRDELGFDLLSTISGIDMQDHLEVVYHVRSLAKNWLVQIKTRTSYEESALPSVVSVWTGANWQERETYDMYGIRFSGHPDLRRMLLDDDFDGYPLLKNFTQTPFTFKPPSTTKVDPQRAIAGDTQKRVERIAQKRLGQGQGERLHPGTPTFGHSHYRQNEPEQKTDKKTSSTPKK